MRQRRWPAASIASLPRRDSASFVGQCGVVVAPRNPESLAAGLISVFETDRRQMEQHSRIRIVENFSVEKMAKLTEESIAALRLLVESFCGY